MTPATRATSVYDAGVKRRFPIRLGVIGAAFAVGMAGGFFWSLLQRRGESDYRDLLAQERLDAEIGQGE